MSDPKVQRKTLTSNDVQRRAENALSPSLENARSEEQEQPQLRWRSPASGSSLEQHRDGYSNSRNFSTQGSTNIAGAGMRRFEKQWAVSQEPERIVFMSGPGGMAFGSNDIRNLHAGLSQQGETVALGDGVGPTSIADVLIEVRKAKEEGRRPVLFIHAHGDMKTGHVIQLQDGVWHPTIDLLRSISTAAGGAPVDVFMTSCYGGGAIRGALDLLPSGSTLTALAPDKSSVAGQDVERFASALKSVSLQFDRPNQLLYLYLTKALRNRISPEVGIAGYGTVKLDDALRARIGVQFSPEELARVQEKLGSILSQAEITEVTEKIRLAKGEFNIPALDYGRALAVALAAL